MGKKIWLYFLVFFFCVDKVYAASLEVHPHSDHINHDQELNVEIKYSIQAPDGSVYYLRGVFGKEGSSNYCGYTWNGSEWFEGPYTKDEGWKKFLKMEVNGSSWSGQLRARINHEDSGCGDSGSYVFRVQRFTEGGSGSYDSQNEVQITIVIPSPTPTPSLTPIPTNPQPSDTPSPTAEEPKNEFKIDTNVLSSKVSNKEKNSSPSAKPIRVQKVEKDSDPSSEIGEQFVAGTTSEPQSKGNALFVICGAVLLLVCCGILLFKFYKEKICNEGIYLNE